MKLKKYRRPALAILAGLGTIMVINSVLSFVVFQQVRGMVNSPSTIDTMMYNRYLLTIVALITPIIGGGVAGYIAKEKGWFYGAIMALIIKLTSIVFISTIFFSPMLLTGTDTPSQNMYQVANKNIFRQLLSLPFAILFIGWGAWMGELIARRRVSPRA